MKRTTVLPIPDRDRMRFSNAFRDCDQAPDTYLDNRSIQTQNFKPMS